MNARTFHTVPLKYRVLAFVNILLFLFCCVECMELSLPISLSTLKIYFLKLRIAKDFLPEAGFVATVIT